MIGKEELCGCWKLAEGADVIDGSTTELLEELRSEEVEDCCCSAVEVVG